MKVSRKLKRIMKKMKKRSENKKKESENYLNGIKIMELTEEDKEKIRLAIIKAFMETEKKVEVET